jgi:hypothetical protein
MAGQNVYDDPELFPAHQRVREAEAGINAAKERFIHPNQGQPPDQSETLNTKTSKGSLFLLQNSWKAIEHAGLAHYPHHGICVAMEQLRKAFHKSEYRTCSIFSPLLPESVSG